MTAADPPRFVVGTGRCGSTLLTRMLGEHPAVCPVNEFFTGLDWGRRFPDGPMTGDELADLIATPNDVTHQALQRGYRAEEITYPFRPGDRYRPDTPVPWVLISTLGRLVDDPDRLYDELVAHARTLAPAPAATQYADLFGWLTRRLGRSVWIERSGSSIDYLGDLLRLWPDARVVHLHRDGPETALSIQAHPFYRLAVCLLYDVVPEVDEDAGEDVVEAMLATPPPTAVCGRYWSDQLLHGMAHVAPLRAAGRYHQVAFEDVLADPVAELAAIAGFFDLPADHGWIERAAGLIRGVPPTRAPALAPAERAALDEACGPGRAALGLSR